MLSGAWARTTAAELVVDGLHFVVASEYCVAATRRDGVGAVGGDPGDRRRLGHEQLRSRPAQVSHLVDGPNRRRSVSDNGVLLQREQTAQAPSQTQKSIRIDRRSRVAKQHGDTAVFPGENPGVAARFRGPVVGSQCPGAAGGARSGLPRRAGVQLESDAGVRGPSIFGSVPFFRRQAIKGSVGRATNSPSPAPGSRRRGLRGPGSTHEPIVSRMQPATTGVV